MSESGARQAGESARFRISARIESRARQAAESARFRVGAGPGRVDVFAAIRGLEMHLLRWPLPAESLEGAFVRRRGAEFVLVNSSSWMTKQRFTAAHELGHAFLTDATIVSQFETDQDLDSDTEANRFAAHFLMDEATVRRCVSDDERPLARVLKVMGEFEVSLPAAAIHLRQLALISAADVSEAIEAQSRGRSIARLARDLGVVSPRSRRPDNARDLGERYVRTLRSLYREGLVDDDRLREVVDLVA